jgi:Domain of unknown function (DUF4386)
MIRGQRVRGPKETVMHDLQKTGGVAALIAAVTYLAGFLLLLTLLAPAAGLDPRGKVEFLVANQATMYFGHLVVYVLNGIALVVVAVALYERLRVGAPAMMQTATAFGLIWAGLVIASGMLILNDLGVVAKLHREDPTAAAAAWRMLAAVEEGLGGGIEVPGGLWVLLVSWAALLTGGLPKALNWLGVVSGVAGLLTVVPTLEVLEAVFGLGLLAWFVWAGIVMLRAGPTRAPSTVSGDERIRR